MSLDICLHFTEYKSHRPHTQSVFMVWLIGIYSFIFAYDVAVSEVLYWKQLDVYTMYCILLDMSFNAYTYVIVSV